MKSACSGARSSFLMAPCSRSGAVVYDMRCRPIRRSPLNAMARAHTRHTPRQAGPRGNCGLVRIRKPRSLAYNYLIASISPYRTVSLLMEIISRQMRPAITRINGIINWPKSLWEMKAISQGGKNSEATVPFHLLPHFHYHIFPFFRIAWSAE